MIRKVFRLENQVNIGPFQTAGGARWILTEVCGHNHTGPRFPTPSLDPGLGCFGIDVLSDWYFGCRDIRQLLHWFPAKSIRALRKLGYGIAVYEVDSRHVRYSKWQLIFKLSNAKRVAFT